LGAGTKAFGLTTGVGFNDESDSWKVVRRRRR
jgi:hypothetical protein